MDGPPAVAQAGAVSKRRNGVRASVRAAADARPAPTPVVRSPDPGCGSDRTGRFHGDHLHGADGRIYRRSGDPITPARAQDLLRSGAPMVIDDCGCFGGCGLDWPDAAERAVLARRPPTLTRRRHGHLEEWHDATGRPLLLLQTGGVRWP